LVYEENRSLVMQNHGFNFRKKITNLIRMLQIITALYTTPAS